MAAIPRDKLTVIFLAEQFSHFMPEREKSKAIKLSVVLRHLLKFV